MVDLDPAPEAHLLPTRLCDATHPDVASLARALAEGAQTEREKAVAAFAFVRDRVKLSLGPWSVPASETLREGAGSQAAQANACVALIRALGLPAGFMLTRVESNAYLGPIVPRPLIRRFPTECVHVTPAVVLDGRWLRCDCTEDAALRRATAHLDPNRRRVEFDGTRDGCVRWSEEAILGTAGPLANGDALLGHPARVSDETAETFDLFVRWARIHGPRHCSLSLPLMHAAFLGWLWDERPNLARGLTRPRLLKRR